MQIPHDCPSLEKLSWSTAEEKTNPQPGLRNRPSHTDQNAACGQGSQVTTHALCSALREAGGSLPKRNATGVKPLQYPRGWARTGCRGDTGFTRSSWPAVNPTESSHYPTAATSPGPCMWKGPGAGAVLHLLPALLSLNPRLWQEATYNTTISPFCVSPGQWNTLASLLELSFSPWTERNWRKCVAMRETECTVKSRWKKTNWR